MNPLPELSILLPGLIAGLLVVATHVPLGREVVRRGIIFIDLAVAQVAALGVLLAHVWHFDHDAWSVQATAFGAALFSALAFHLLEKRWEKSLEALIGSAYVLAASASILVLANNPHGGEHLREVLVGQILWVDADQLLATGLLYATLLALWFGLPRFRGALFYPVFAFAITASVQLVGVFLVFASLILPALAIRNLGRCALTAGYVIGGAGYASGLLLSSLTDLPTGAIIVWTLALCALAAGLLLSRRPREG